MLISAEINAASSPKRNHDNKDTCRIDTGANTVAPPRKRIPGWLNGTQRREYGKKRSIYVAVVSPCADKYKSTRADGSKRSKSVATPSPPSGTLASHAKQRDTVKSALFKNDADEDMRSENDLNITGSEHDANFDHDASFDESIQNETSAAEDNTHENSCHWDLLQRIEEQQKDICRLREKLRVTNEKLSTDAAYQESMLGMSFAQGVEHARKEHEAELERIEYVMRESHTGTLEQLKSDLEGSHMKELEKQKKELESLQAQLSASSERTHLTAIDRMKEDLKANTKRYESEFAKELEQFHLEKGNYELQLRELKQKMQEQSDEYKSELAKQKASKRKRGAKQHPDSLQSLSSHTKPFQEERNYQAGKYLADSEPTVTLKDQRCDGTHNNVNEDDQKLRDALRGNIKKGNVRWDAVAGLQAAKASLHMVRGSVYFLTRSVSYTHSYSRLRLCPLTFRVH